MIRRAIGAWLRARSAVELAALAAGLLVFGFLGWDSALWDARAQLVLHLVAVGAVGGLGIAVWRGHPLPRSPLDLPILLLLAAYALSTMLALNVGLSLRAAGSVAAFAAMVPVALIVIHRRPSWAALVVCIPSLLLASGALGALLARRIQWVLAGAPGLPPIRMLGEGTPFGSVAVPPFVLLGCWALAGVLEPPLRTAIRRLLVVVGVPLAILSGSRSAWLAIATTALLLGGPALWHRRAGLLRAAGIGWRRAASGVAVLLGVLAVGVLIAPRVTALTSLLYRGDLWRDTLTAWAHSPITGIGPGLMPYARQAAAPAMSFPVNQPHSHNLALGVLGDAGLVGLGAGALLVATFAVVAGPWRSRSAVGRASSSTLIGFAVAGMFEDLTFVPGFNLIVILLGAVALIDAGAVEWVRLPRRRRAAVLGLGALVAIPLVVAMVVADAGAIEYRRGMDAAEDGLEDEAALRFAHAAEIDPWHPMAAAAAGQMLATQGDLAGARTALEAAVKLNPGNVRAWVNLAYVCLDLEEAGCAVHAAGRAVDTARLQDATLLNAALVLESLGETDAADAAYRRSLLTQPLTSFAAEWPRPIGAGDGIVDEAYGAAPELGDLVARRSAGEVVDPASYLLAPVRALAHAIHGEDEEAAAWLATARRTLPDAPLTWEVDLALARHRGESLDRSARIYAVLRGSDTPRPEEPSTLPTRSFDLAAFRTYPGDGLLARADHLQVEPAYPWTLEALLPPAR